MNVLHTAIWVSDIEDTLEFYVDTLGLEKTNEFVSGDGATNVYVAGDDDAELQFKYDPDREVPEPAGIDHIALTVDDTDAMVERLVEETDCTLERGPLDSEGASARVAFLEGPDGYGLELVEPFE
ncbi:VOC family protein [Natrarchaeobaculum aegyptiacum]|uniref:Bleomycin resistance protein n=1 Tax=Natrarchaeobaculum aegyptiacum TaxID=745377 RepID=A0A2Z2HU78_9EURY|nr:VOC family protein [Natrarchaeobaculum aegyptiacum]ARS90732.1 bleomycin resistance protein [Natrarchaeobaculum aegyptiacum]